MDYEGSYRGRWMRRRYFDWLETFLPVIRECDSDCVPHFLSGHIGVFNRRIREDFNFVGFKGSARRHFSIEIKVNENERDRLALKANPDWLVERYTAKQGYRVHLPKELTADQVQQLKDLVRRAYREWPIRMDRLDGLP